MSQLTTNIAHGPYALHNSLQSIFSVGTASNDEVCDFHPIAFVLWYSSVGDTFMVIELHVWVLLIYRNENSGNKGFGKSYTVVENQLC